MKIVIAHNHYSSSSPSGENAVVAREVDALRRAGHEVVEFMRHSDQIRSRIDLAKAAAGPVYAPSAVRNLRDLLRAERPDILHLHNPYPLISPAVVRVARRQSVPVVQTVHNYRHSCLKGTHFRDGGVCTLCISRRFPGPGVSRACYRDSSAQSLSMALGHLVHSETWQMIDLFIVLTPFMRTHMMQIGIDSSKLVVRPSWMPDPRGSSVNSYADSGRGRTLLFVGRLDVAKGVHLLLEAWRKTEGADLELSIVGDGPLRDDVARASALDPRLKYLGRLAPEDVHAVMRSSTAVLIPSLWYEGFPLTLVEAFANSKPVITCEGGSVASIVGEKCGWVSRADSSSLSRTIDSLSVPAARVKGDAARSYFETFLSEEKAMGELLELYTRLLSK